MRSLAGLLFLIGAGRVAGGVLLFFFNSVVSHLIGARWFGVRASMGQAQVKRLYEGQAEAVCLVQVGARLKHYNALGILVLLLQVLN